MQHSVRRKEERDDDAMTFSDDARDLLLHLSATFVSADTVLPASGGPLTLSDSPVCVILKHAVARGATEPSNAT